MQVEKGRAIYSGIQKFVAFIMSVHIAEARLKKLASSSLRCQDLDEPKTMR